MCGGRGGVGGVSFCVTCEDLGKKTINYSFPACAFFFFKVGISSRILIPLFRLGSVHSGAASRDDCGRVFPDELRVSSFPYRFPHYACGIVSPLRHRYVKGVRMFMCNLPPALLAEWPMSCTCHCGNTGGGTDTE